MKKFFAVLLSVCMLLVGFAGFAFAEYYDEGNDGNSWETAYIIDSVEDFMLMRSRANSDESGKYYKLAADLDLTPQTNFDYLNFDGHFDGQGHLIKININLSNTEDYWTYYSLFSDVHNNAEIIYLNVTGDIVLGPPNTLSIPHVGGIVGQFISGVIEHCSFIGNIECSEYSFSGGIVALLGYYEEENYDAIIKNCSAKVNIISHNHNSYNSSCVGGIAGATFRGKIENCTVIEGSIMSELDTVSNFAARIGGIVGISGMLYSRPIGDWHGKTEVINCTSNATLSGNTEFKGGIIGSNTPYYPEDLTLSGNSWPSQYPEVGNGTSYNTPVTPVNPNNPDDQTVTELPPGVIQPVELSADVLEKIAQVISVDAEALHMLTDENIFEPEEPTQAMRDYVKNENYELVGKLNVLSVDVEGWYVFKVRPGDSLWSRIQGQDISNYKIYALNDSESEASSAFILNGLLNTWEILTMSGEKMDKFGVREFLMVGFLNASKPLCLFVAKLLLSLLTGGLAGCNAGVAGAGVLVIALVFMRHIRRK